MIGRFPQEAALRDGTKVLIRPFTAEDVDTLYEFFLRLPAEVRRFAWDPIEDRSLVERWGRCIDYSKVLPLLAVDGRKVVADASIHRRDRGPLRMNGRVTWLLDPAYRGLGLGITLVNHFISIAREEGLRHLTCTLISDLESDAVQTLSDLGFVAYPLPDYGADPDGNPHDMVKMVLRL